MHVAGKQVIFGLFMLVLILLIGVGVIVSLIVNAAKEVDVAGSTLKVKGTNNETVQTASSDFSVSSPGSCILHASFHAL